jgi:hypothetical protein
MLKDTAATNAVRLRVSVATLDRVVFPHPQDGTPILALERTATVMREGGDKVQVRAHSFGGGVRLLNSGALQAIVGPIHFDSERSQSEQDFRILIRPSDWEAVKQFCLQHLGNPNDAHLESVPHRELVEEFADTLSLSLKPDQYTYRAGGFVVANDPTPTNNAYARGQPTVRLYRIFEVRIVDDALCTTMLAASQQYSDQDLEGLALKDARNGGKGRANSTLTLPLSLVAETYLSLPPEQRYKAITVEGHQLAESVLAILEEVDVPQYHRL